MGKRRETNGNRGNANWRWRTTSTEQAESGPRDGFLDALEDFRRKSKADYRLTANPTSNHGTYQKRGSGRRDSRTIAGLSGDRRYNRATRVRGTEEDVLQIEDGDMPMSVLQLQMELENGGLGLSQKRFSNMENREVADLPLWELWKQSTAYGYDDDNPFFMEATPSLVPEPLQIKKESGPGRTFMSTSRRSTKHDDEDDALDYSIINQGARQSSNDFFMTRSRSVKNSPRRLDLDKQLPKLPTHPRRQQGSKEQIEKETVRSAGSPHSHQEAGKRANTWDRSLGFMRSLRHKGQRHSGASSLHSQDTPEGPGARGLVSTRHSADSVAGRKPRNSGTTIRSASARLIADGSEWAGR